MITHSQQDIETVPSDREGIVQRLKKYGIAVLPNYLAPDNLLRFQAQFFKIMEHNFGEGITIDKGRDRLQIFTEMPSINGVVHDFEKFTEEPIVEQIANDFFAPYAYKLDACYATLTQEEDPFVHEWHIDGFHTCLKFFFYLNDVNLDNGPFHYNMGSHHEGFFRQMYFDYKYGLSYKQEWPHTIIPSPDTTIINDMPITGKAGTLILFNSMGMHRAGNIKAGKERHVVRFHIAPDVQAGGGADGVNFQEYFNVSEHIGINPYITPEEHRHSRGSFIPAYGVSRLSDPPIVDPRVNGHDLNLLPCFKENDRVSIFAAGESGEKVLKKVKHEWPDVDIICFGDNNTARHGEYFHELPIVSAESIVEQMPNWVIIANKTYFVDIFKNLSALGYPAERMIQYG